MSYVLLLDILSREFCKALNKRKIEREEMADKNIFSLFFREKAMALLLALHQTKTASYASTLAKKIHCPSSHIRTLLQEMEKAGILVFEKHGRLKLVVLTKKGKEIAEELQNLQQKL